MLSVKDHRSLQAAVLAMKAADGSLKSEINKATRQVLNPVWRSQVEAHLAGRGVMDSKVLGTGVRIAAGNPPVAKAAQSRRAIGDGKRIIPNEAYSWWEFGAPHWETHTYQRRNRTRGGTHTVHDRHTNRGLPDWTAKGRVVYPAFKDIAPRAVSLWVQLIV
ncbi:MAG: hypothetical protein KJ548_00140, partial [Actinobacteria bacterium]|nr:hypothetical protein [Actinomycetota bacterium]